MDVGSADDPKLEDLIGEERGSTELLEDVAPADGAGTRFDLEAFRDGRQTPVFFGSALSNFGVEPFLDALVELAPPPRAARQRSRRRRSGRPTDFTGFVFKIQANMDPRHRDRVAFLRVCSGVFDEGHGGHQRARSGETVRLSRAQPLLRRASARRSRRRIPATWSAWSTPDCFAIGDTLYAGAPVQFRRIPRFPAEYFGVAAARDVTFKQFDEGSASSRKKG